jgi:DNA-binding transcriptional LysR family regulator
MTSRWSNSCHHRRVDLEALRAYLAVVETGSFVSAAASLRYARATLRRRVDELEAQAGVPLLHRTGQGATPTEAGRVLADRGRRILREASALLSSVREVGAEPSGTVRFVLPVGLPPELLTPLYAILRERYPKLHLRIRFADDPMTGLLKDVDVAVCFDRGAVPEGPWISHELLRIREGLFATPRYLKRQGTPGSPDDLAGHDLLVWEAPDADATSLPLRSGAELRVDPALACADIHLLRQCAGADLGIAFVPDGDVPDLQVSGLVPVLPEAIGRERALRVVLPAALSDIPRIKAVLDLVRTFVGTRAVAGRGGKATKRRSV